MSDTDCATSVTSTVSSEQIQQTPEVNKKRYREITSPKVSPPLKVSKAHTSHTTINKMPDSDPDMIGALIIALANPGVINMFEGLIDTAVDRHLKTLSDSVSKQEEQINKLEMKLKDVGTELTWVKGQLDEQEQYGRRNGLRVWNNIKEETGESTDTMIIDIAKGMGVAIKPHDISRSHRVGRPTRDGRARPILVKFTTYRAREKLYSAKKKTKDGIFMGEDLTRHRQNLFYKVRTEKKSGRFTHAWTSDGRVLVAYAYLTVVLRPLHNYPTWITPLST